MIPRSFLFSRGVYNLGSQAQRVPRTVPITRLTQTTMMPGRASPFSTPLGQTTHTSSHGIPRQTHTFTLHPMTASPSRTVTPRVAGIVQRLQLGSVSTRTSTAPVSPLQQTSRTSLPSSSPSQSRLTTPVSSPTPSLSGVKVSVRSSASSFGVMIQATELRNPEQVLANQALDFLSQMDSSSSATSTTRMQPRTQIQLTLEIHPNESNVTTGSNGEMSPSTPATIAVSAKTVKELKEKALTEVAKTNLTKEEKAKLVESVEQACDAMNRQNLKN